MALHFIKVVFYHFFYQHFHYAFSQGRTHLMALWKSSTVVAGKNFVPEVGVQMNKIWLARPWVTLAMVFIIVLGTETTAMHQIRQSFITVQHWPNVGMTLITKDSYAKVSLYLTCCGPAPCMHTTLHPLSAFRSFWLCLLLSFLGISQNQEFKWL